MATVTTYSNSEAQENKICHCFHFSLFFLHEVIGPDCFVKRLQNVFIWA